MAVTDMELLSKLKDFGGIAIIRCSDQESGQRTADAIIAAGMTSIEITLTTPGALKIIENLAARPGLRVGVGTVLSTKDVADAASAGAQFIISPHTDIEIIKATKNKGLLSLPGVITPSEVATALSAGADVLKFFPAFAVGPAYLKALTEPFPNNLWCPTGGMSVATIPDWFAAGASMVGIGGPLTAGGFEAIAKNVSDFMDAINKAKGVKV